MRGGDNNTYIHTYIHTKGIILARSAVAGE